MSTIHQSEAYNPLGARISRVEAIAVTTSSVVIDLSTRTNIWGEIQKGRLLLADADGGDVYYAFNSQNGGTIDQTNTTAGNATQCARIPSGTLVPLRPPFVGQAEANQSTLNVGVTQYLLVKGTAACTLRLSVISETPSLRGA